MPRGLEAHLNSMSVVQQRRALLRVNKIADACFRECCTDFGFSKYLGSTEEQCLNSCIDKYVLLSASTGMSFGQYLSSEGER